MITQYRGMLYDYEQSLLGKSNVVSPYFFRNNSDEENEKRAIYLLKFAIAYYLKWTPAFACEKLNWKVIELIKLDSVIKYIRYPINVEDEEDIFFVKVALFPNAMAPDKEELTRMVYRKLLDRNLYKMPKGYFSDIGPGKERMEICLRYAISQEIGTYTPEEIYKYFAQTTGKKLLKKYRLFSVCLKHYDTQVDFLHEALPKEKRDELWFRYYKFEIMQRELKDAEKRAKKKIALEITM